MLKENRVIRKPRDKKKRVKGKPCFRKSILVLKPKIGEL